MDRILSDRAIKILIVIVGIIVIIDVVNVFAMGGPSVFALIFKQGATGSTTGTSSSSGENVNRFSPLSAAPANATFLQAGENSTAGSGSSPGDIQAIYVPTKATPEPTVRYVTAVTPIQAETSESSLRYVQPQTQTLEVEDNYVTIYSDDLSYQTTGTPTAVALKVAEPPLIINFTVSPTMTLDSKLIYNHTATHQGHDELVNVTRPSESSRFTVTIYDKDTGMQVDQDGYGGVYDQLADNTYTLREAGNYLIQFNGANADVHVDMFLKREGNIV